MKPEGMDCILCPGGRRCGQGEKPVVVENQLVQNSRLPGLRLMRSGRSLTPEYLTFLGAGVSVTVVSEDGEGKALGGLRLVPVASGVK